VSRYLPGERDPRDAQESRSTPGRRSSARASFGDDETRRSTAVDAMRMGHSIGDDEAKAGYPWHTRPSAVDEEEETLRGMAHATATGRLGEDGDLLVDEDGDFLDADPDPISGTVLALPADHDGAEEHGPFLAGALSGEAMRRSGDVIVDDEPDQDEDEYYLDDEALLYADEELFDDGDYLPPAA
jgi:hypothetical protein